VLSDFYKQVVARDYMQTGKKMNARSVQPRCLLQIEAKGLIHGKIVLGVERRKG